MLTYAYHHTGWKCWLCVFKSTRSSSISVSDIIWRSFIYIFIFVEKAFVCCYIISWFRNILVHFPLQWWHWIWKMDVWDLFLFIDQIWLLVGEVFEKLFLWKWFLFLSIFMGLQFSLRHSWIYIVEIQSWTCKIYTKLDGSWRFLLFYGLFN